jgi:WD40 repeat protein
MDQHRCPLCHLEKSRITLENDCAVALLDAFPVTEGHMLVVPKRHVASLFNLPDEEQAALWRPDGRFGVSASGGEFRENRWQPGTERTVRLWDLATGKELCRFAGHTHVITGVHVTRDGGFALSSSHDKSLRVWRLPPRP